MLSVLACGHLCAGVQNEGVHIHTHIGVYVHVLERVSDPVCCALACGYLEVSADVVSACGSGFTIFCLIETCIHLADSSTVRRKSLLSTFCSPVTFKVRGIFERLKCLLWM